MAGMFPTMVRDPNDPNRDYSAKRAPGDPWPNTMRAAYYLICAAGVLMLVIALLLLSAEVPQDTPDEAWRQTLATNKAVTAWGNIILAVVLVGAASYFPKGSRVARRLAAGCVALACFLNVAAFIVRLTAWASMIVVILLAVSMLLAFRPDSNAFVEEKSPRFQ